MYGPLKISKHQHTGRLRPHEHTSYAVLALLLVIVGGIMVIFTLKAFAQDPPPQAGSIGLTGSVPAPPPKQAATITNPIDGARFSNSPITVSGSCPDNTIVEIYKNNIFAGSTPCQSGGTYSLQIDLLFGANELVAQVYDALNQAGPQSKSVNVTYIATLPQALPSNILNFTGQQLILNTNAVYRGTFPNQVLNIPINIIGGTAPFAINVEWGDSSNSLIPHNDNSTFNASHTYKRAGTFEVTLQATDSNQLVAFLTVAVIVNGQPSVIASSVSFKTPSTNKFLVLWPLFAIAATALISFWLGERREKHILNSVAQLQQLKLGSVQHP